MNKEEIMNKIQLYDFCENMEELYDDYYVPLQQENKELKQKYLNAVSDYEQEKAKNNRAIEYIHIHYYEKCFGEWVVNSDDLLEILESDSNE